MVAIEIKFKNRQKMNWYPRKIPSRGTCEYGASENCLFVGFIFPAAEINLTYMQRKIQKIVSTRPTTKNWNEYQYIQSSYEEILEDTRP